MTDKKDPVVTTYPFIGETGKVVPGSQEEQLIDLDAAYKETGSTDAKELVEGLERYLVDKVLSKRVMTLAGASGCEQFDPMPSKRNAVLGGESFITAIKDGFLKVIDYIIKFIKAAANWVIERIKILFGFGKTQQKIKACDDAREKLEAEMKETLSGLGVNPEIYSIDRLVESAPQSIDRLEMFKYLSVGVQNETQMAAALKETLPELSKLSILLKNSSESLTQKHKQFKNTLDQTRKKLKSNHLSETDKFELSKKIKDVMTISEDYGKFVGQLSKVTSLLYGVDLEQSKLLEAGIPALKTKLGEVRVAATSKVSGNKISSLYNEITQLNKLVISGVGRSLDFSSLGADVLKQIVALDDASFIQNVGAATGDSELLSDYQRMAVSVRDYVAYVEITSSICTDIMREIENFSRWKDKADTILAAAAYADLNTLAMILHSMAGRGEYDLTKVASATNILPQGQAEALMATREITQEVLDHDLAGVKTALNNFARQTGLGIRIN